jgi:ech hydrogenase subunit E
LHFEVAAEEEVVKGVEPALGYNHRGMEYALEKDWKRNFFLSERVCGICSFHHSTTYSQAMEVMTGTEPPERARLIRTILLEVQRITSHTLALGHVAESMGYENLFMQFFREREEFLRIANEISGNRIHYCMNWLGGVRRDISPEQGRSIEKRMDAVQGRLEELAKVVQGSTWLKRTKGWGASNRRQTWAVGASGRRPAPI